MNNMLNSILKMTVGDVKKHPMYQQAIKMTYGKSEQEIKQMIDNMAMQKGININQLLGR